MDLGVRWVLIGIVGKRVNLMILSNSTRKKYDEIFVKSYINIERPTDVLTIIALGPKFAISPNVMLIFEIFTDIEYIKSAFAEQKDQKANRRHLAYTLTQYSRKHTHHNRVTHFL